ncbi:MAG: restriction endonuclease subunit S [Methanobacteriaceae archaeon]|nr:restriction endonuclease subunit S [Methanobacteriaceae archaeon]
MIDYPTKKLEEAVYFQEGPGLRTFQFKSAGIKVINVANVRDGFLNLFTTKFLDPDEVSQKYKHFLVNENDILVSTSGTIGRVALVTKKDLPLMLNTSIVRFHTLDENRLLNKFLFYFLGSHTFINELLKYKTGVAIFNVGPSHIKKIKISLPSLEIQKQIVERLDKIAEAQKLNDELIQKTNELFQSLLHKKLNPASKDWGVKKIKDVATVGNGGTPSTKNQKYWNGKILWLTPKELSGFEDMEIFDTERKISDHGLNHSSAALFPTGTVLFTSRAPIGYIVIAGVPMATNQGFKNFVCDSKQLNNKFLYFFLRLKKKYLQSLGRGATFTEISKTIIEKVEIPLPPLGIQKQIVAKLSAVQDYKKQLLWQKTKLKELFDSVLAKSMKG